MRRGWKKKDGAIEFDSGADGAKITVKVESSCGMNQAPRIAPSASAKLLSLSSSSSLSLSLALVIVHESARVNIGMPCGNIFARTLASLLISSKQARELRAEGLAMALRYNA